LKVSDRALRSVVFGEEIFYSVKATALPSAEKMDLLRKDWDGRLTELIKRYAGIRATVSDTYTKILSEKMKMKDADLIADVRRRAVPYYEQQVLRTGRPFHD
jgi:hypothetical protein